MGRSLKRAGMIPFLVGAILGSAPALSSAGVPTVSLELLTTGLDRPVGITHAGDGSGRIFIVEKTGAIRIVDAAGTLVALPFLDLSSQVSGGSEQGLLGLAFHPDYESNGYFYVHYTDSNGDSRISRFSVSAGDPDLADPASELVLLTVLQPFSNHNAGQIEFGPDGYLYVAFGDGGSGGDPGDRAQDLALLLGKMLRIDVDTTDPGLDYGIPADNPFVGVAGAREEIWSSGLRNPWRFSFDRHTGDLFIGDVGQNAWEEIDLQPASSGGGENWGWRCYEGNVVFNFSTCSAATTFDFPIIVYAHSAGNCSVNGGYRYRGGRYPNLVGTYVYGDYCTGKIWGATYDGAIWNSVELFDMPASQSSFGQDERGELYVAVLSAAPNGAIHRIVDTSTPQHLFTDGFESGDTTTWSSSVP